MAKESRGGPKEGFYFRPREDTHIYNVRVCVCINTYTYISPSVQFLLEILSYSKGVGSRI